MKNAVKKESWIHEASILDAAAWIKETWSTQTNNTRSSYASGNMHWSWRWGFEHWLWTVTNLSHLC